MRVLLLSAYAAQSHRYWQRGLEQMFPQWQWTALSLPPRHFSWRVRGNPLYWSLAERHKLERDYQLLIATSMVDLATLRGLVPALASVPSALYFHENQFEFPQHRQQHSLLEVQMVSVYSALAADALVFNSAFNRDSFLRGCERLLARLPDFVPPHIAASLADKASVLPVPLLPVVAADSWGWSAGDALRILWSARFEHDKGGEGLQRILQGLEQAGVDYQLAITGQQFRNSPPVFSRIGEQFAHRLVHFGFVDDESQYRALQAGADLVLSTADHEFQGLAVMEAVAAGCVPVVPDRLAYRELYPAACRYASCPDQPAAEADSAVALIRQLAAEKPAPPAMTGYTLAALRPRYEALLRALQDSQSRPS
ncbi:DUF3524 domain-containing protein [Seongchinamella sediminis]|uniref:tRNA-queuosine alpha-mannosyltransferase n=1 Tax=Seongchinamella sediminis TaxID=2283635 RepID=A0A3L7DW22_9GAMM|nr:DUF3524 domain-containing protein [Seongchinamella sediminis]RLQ21514.1 DUF3524 domain-containing protein [Seongchinamella sediminis]